MTDTRRDSPAPSLRMGPMSDLRALDPPYTSDEHSVRYAAQGSDVAASVAQWAVENGGNPSLRIALCGYDGEHDMPATWECVPWKAKGGYANTRKAGTNGNAHRERVWFSPHCLDGRQASLFTQEIA